MTEWLLSGLAGGVGALLCIGALRAVRIAHPFRRRTLPPVDLSRYRAPKE